jgi:hypothetical protein
MVLRHGGNFDNFTCCIDIHLFAMAINCLLTCSYVYFELYLLLYLKPLNKNGWVVILVSKKKGKNVYFP